MLKAGYTGRYRESVFRQAVAIYIRNIMKEKDQSSNAKTTEKKNRRE